MSKRRGSKVNPIYPKTLVLNNPNKWWLYLQQNGKCASCREIIPFEEITLHHGHLKEIKEFTYLLCEDCHDEIEPWRIIFKKLKSELEQIKQCGQFGTHKANIYRYLSLLTGGYEKILAFTAQDHFGFLNFSLWEKSIHNFANPGNYTGVIMVKLSIVNRSLITEKSMLNLLNFQNVTTLGKFLRSAEFRGKIKNPRNILRCIRYHLN